MFLEDMHYTNLDGRDVTMPYRRDHVRLEEQAALVTMKELGTPWRLVETEPKGYNCGS